MGHETYALRVLDVIDGLHGARCGSGEPLPEAEEARLLSWLRWRVTEGWHPSSIARFAGYENAVRELALACLREWAPSSAQG